MMQITERDTRGAAVEAEMRDPVLATHDVGVRYDETKVALSGVNLEFAAGEVTSLIGPSGCGKSTFLRCLNLMNREIPHCHIDGEIVYDGHNINMPDENLYELRQSIGMVFQIPNPFRKSIRDNITFAPRCHGIKDKKRLDEIVETSLVKAALWDEVKTSSTRAPTRFRAGSGSVCASRVPLP